MELLLWQKHWPRLQRLPLCVLLGAGKLTLGGLCLVEKGPALRGSIHLLGLQDEFSFEWGEEPISAPPVSL